MSAVLLDNWTLYDISYPSGITFEGQMDNLENLLMSILLWDEVYYWNNEMTSLWENGSRIRMMFEQYEQSSLQESCLQGITLPQDVEYMVKQVPDNDGVAGGAKRYQIIAEVFGFDYLPKKERYEYLKNQGYYNRENAVWPKIVLGTVKDSVQKYYGDLAKMLRGIKLEFDFPLLIDYIRYQARVTDHADVTSNYVSVALQIKGTEALQNMRTWIDDLRKCLDSRNLIGAEHMMKDVGDIVSQLRAPQEKKMRMKGVTIQPVLPFFTVNFDCNLSSHKPQTQLAFLYNLVSYALEGH